MSQALEMGLLFLCSMYFPSFLFEVIPIISEHNSCLDPGDLAKLDSLTHPPSSHLMCFYICDTK